MKKIGEPLAFSPVWHKRQVETHLFDQLFLARLEEPSYDHRNDSTTKTSAKNDLQLSDGDGDLLVLLDFLGRESRWGGRP